MSPCLSWVGEKRGEKGKKKEGRVSNALGRKRGMCKSLIRAQGFGGKKKIEVGKGGGGATAELSWPWKSEL